MNSMLRITYYIFMLLNFCIATADACTIDGRWYDPTGYLAPWTFVQDNSIFTGVMDQDPNKPHECGITMASGTINNMTLNASLYYGASRSRSGECILTTQVIGTFTEECYSIAGTWTDDGAAGQFQLNRVPITIIEPKTENDLIITAEPKMPAFKAVVAIDQFHSAFLNAAILPYTWHLVIDNEPIPGIRKFQMTLDDVSTTESNYEPDFNLLMAHETVQEKEVITPVTEGIVGGQLSLWVYYYKDNNSSNLYPASDLKIYNIKGTNPGQAAIESMLTDSMSQQIACQESRYKQFDADREGGIGLPLIGKNDKGKAIGGAGI